MRASVFGVSLLGTMAPLGASAGDLSISTATTTPVVTSNADGAGAGDVEVTSSGSLTVGASETAITIDSDNSVTNAGAINALAADGVGIEVSSDTTGGIVNTGTITTGTAQTDTDAVVEGGPAVQVNADLGEGVSNSGTIRSYGSVAVLFEPSLANITVGATADGASLYNEGGIYAYAYDSSAGGTTAVRIGGGGFTTTLTDGIVNDTAGVIGAYGYDQDATAISIQSGAVIGGAVSLSNLGTIRASTAAGGGDVGGEAVAIDIALGGDLASIENEGSITATASVDGTNATAIRDASGTLTSIVNSGSITATATDTGQAIAIDLSASSATVLIENEGSISGDMLFGAGAYTLNSTDGTIGSDIAVDGGSLTMTLSGGSVSSMSSTLTSGGTLFLTVDDAIFYVPEGEVFEATTANFGADSTFFTTFDPVNLTTSGYVLTTGATTFDVGATVDVNFTSYLATTASLLIAEGGSIVGDAGIELGGVTAGYNAVLNLIGNQLYLDLERKTAAELGYSGYLAAIYNAAPTALESDDVLGSAIGGIGTEAELEAAYTQLLPDLTGAREKSAVMAQNLANDAIASRLFVLRNGEGGTASRGKRSHTEGWWAKETFSTIKRDGNNVTGYDGDTFALSLGYDSFDGNGGAGISFTYAGSTIGNDRSGSEDSSFVSYALQLYKSFNAGPAYWDLIGGVALNEYEMRRQILIGAVDYLAEADSMGYQGMVSTDAGYRMDMGALMLVPSIRADYTYLLMESYSESGAGGANLDIDSGDFQSLRARAALRASLGLGEKRTVEPYVEGGYSAELLAEDVVVDGRFHSGGAFSLTGEQANESAAFVNAGVIYRMARGSLSGGYGGEFGSDSSSHQLSVTATLQF
ncbi:autotransporter domain-containing protein [Parvibaculum sp.]|nr:autotransporter outer membrane beta-barrel domain-containing protein [Parvibaculum sp.]